LKNKKDVPHYLAFIIRQSHDFNIIKKRKKENVLCNYLQTFLLYFYFYELLFNVQLYAFLEAVID
jgi:hypothetical protein